MNLLHVTSSMDPRVGGPCEGVRNLAANVSSLGNNVQVVCLDDPDSDYLSKETIQVHALGRGKGPWSYHSRLSPWLDQNLPQFDAVIQNGIWQYPGYALYKALRQPGSPPCLIFPHGMLDPWFQRAPDRRLKAVRNWIYWKLIQRRIIHNAAALLFTCAEEKRLARTTFSPYHPKREIVVGYGTAPPPEYHEGMDAAFAEKCPELNRESFLLFLGRIHPKKGVDLLIKAYAAHSHVRTAGGKPAPLKLVIAGPGLETPFGRSMQELAAKECSPGSVFWPGMLTGDAKWGALYRADAFVLVSHQENFGIAVAEALACRTPVLISKQINIWSEILDSKAGFAAPDTLAGAQKLLQQWEALEPARKKVMKHAARACFKKHFSILQAATKLLEAVHGALENLPEHTTH